MRIKPVVVAVDGSGESLRAARWAAREAARRKAPLRIVSAPAMPPRMAVCEGSMPTVANMLQDVSVSAVRAAAAVVTEAEPALTVDTDLIPGVPADAVTASGAGACMLVVGAKGDGSFTAMVLGSVSRYVAANAVCPVAVVRDVPDIPRGRVVVGVREPDDAEAALGFAFEEAASRKAELHIVHAWHWLAPALSRHEAGIDPEMLSARARRNLAELLAPWQQKYPSLRVKADVLRGNPAQVLNTLSSSADLLVLGRHVSGPHSYAGGIASVRHAVLGHARTPVVIVPAER